MYSGPEPPPIAGLAAEANDEGIRFVQRTIDAWRSGENRFDHPGEAFFLVRDEDEVVGMCGLNIDPFVDLPSVGRVRHLYVSPSRRREGLGTVLVLSVIDAAADRFDSLRLRTYDPVADAFYVEVGFARRDHESATHTMDLTLPTRFTSVRNRPDMKYAVADNAAGLAAMAADLIESEIAMSGRLVLGLAGGSTPQATYRELARRAIDWGNVTGWIPDERWVPVDHPDSNQAMARAAFADAVGLEVVGPDTNAVNPSEAAVEYGDIVIPMLTDPATRSVTLLGVGVDGHTASLFPGTPAVEVAGVSYVANFVSALDTWRVTASFGLLAQSDVVVFVVSGAAKAKVIGAIADGEDLPAGRVTAQERVVWLLDEDAAALIGHRNDAA